MVEEKDINIQYIWSEEKLAEITTKNSSEEYFARNMRRITEGELWEIVDTGRENIKKTGVTDYVTTCDKNEYPIHEITEFMDGENRNE